MNPGNRTREENANRWKKWVEGAEGYSGAMKTYCMEKGITVVALRYWRKKLKIKPPEVLEKPSPFMSVEVLTGEKVIPIPVMPEPKWVAEFIFHLSSNFRGSEQ